MPWELPDSEAALLDLARCYPYCRPGACYLFRAGEARPLPEAVARAELFAERTPVIAHGSNRSPRQLARKFGAAAEIPVSRAWLGDYDVVYSAHMTRYGAIAANLCHAPGTRVEVWVNWLDETQLARMHETELGAEIYCYGFLEGVSLAPDSGPQDGLSAVGVYLSTAGYLPLDGRPIALAAVPAENRRMESLTQRQALALVRQRHRNGRELDELVLAKIRDPSRRRALIAELRAAALPTEAPHFQAVAT
jgi:hypothetical protein